MNFFDRLKAETDTARQHLYTALLIHKALTQEITLEEYVGFLTQAHHNVKHTTTMLMTVGARLPEQKEWLRIDRSCVVAKTNNTLSHDNLFHSVLGMLNILSTENYQAELDIFDSCKSNKA